MILLDIPGWLTPHEGQFLTRVARSVHHKKGEVVEIGSYLGKSTVCLAASGDHMYAIDPHEGEFSGGKTDPTLKTFLNNLKKAGVKNLVTPIVKTSRKAASFWKKPIKLLFIDGLHDYDHALEDYMLWNSFVVHGGIIAMHDAFCGWDGAGRVALRHIVYSPDFAEIGVVGSIVYGIKGKASLGQALQKVFRQGIIELCVGIYNMKVIPKWIQFILVHRFLRILLINRFSSF